MTYSWFFLSLTFLKTLTSAFLQFHIRCHTFDWRAVLKNSGKLFCSVWFSCEFFMCLGFLLVLVCVPLYFILTVSPSLSTPTIPQKVQLIQKFTQHRLRFVALSLWPTFIFLTGQSVKRPGRHELLRHSCTCIPDIPCVYHLLAGASLDPVRTHRGEQTGCSPRRNEWMHPIHHQL